MSKGSCSDVLCTIGRDLDWRGIRTFFLECGTNRFIVEGGYQLPAAVMPVTLHYALDDIERLDREARDRKNHISSVKDFLNLSQILWAIGTYVSGKQGRLRSLSNTASTGTMPVFTIEYETARGEVIVDVLKGSAIYELSTRIYKLRVTSSTESCRYTRFSDSPEARQS
jgi:hypothetical protein